MRKPVVSKHSYEPFNAVIGRMVLDLFGFEGRVDDHRTRLEMQAVVEMARSEASRIGVDPSCVDEVAARIVVEGR